MNYNNNNQNNQQQQPPQTVMSFEMSDFETIPRGFYQAYFKTVESTNHPQWGNGVMFIFEVANGPHQGATATRIGKPKPTLKNSTGKILSGIAGRRIEAGERVDLNQYINKLYNIVVEETEAGKTRIESVSPLEMQTMPTAATGYQQPPSQGHNAQFQPQTQQQPNQATNSYQDIPF